MAERRRTKSAIRPPRSTFSFDIVELCLKKRPPAVWRTNCRRIYEVPLLPHPKPEKPGKILRRWHAMNGFAGLSLPKNQRREEIMSNGQSRSLWKESAALAVGLAVFIARKKRR